MPQPVSGFRTATTAVLALAALAVVAPYSVRGIACGHDLAFHMNGWMEVAQQWRQGVLYPRWAALANYGSGEPRFLFYPPLSWLLGGALGSVMPWLFVPVAFDFIAVLLAGLTMFRMAREWFVQPDATLIALGYALNPYMLLSIYVRSAFAEILAASLLPLLVLWIVRKQPGKKMLLPLALTFAAVWLTNVPAAIMATYLSVLLLAVVTVVRRNSRTFFWGVTAMAIGLAVAAFYVVPVLYEKSWITPSQLLSAGVRPDENFLFAWNGEPQHDTFLRAISWLATGELAATGIAMFMARRWRRVNPALWWSLVAIVSMATAFMLPITGFLYHLLPDLRFLQFPWRWLLGAGLAYAVFLVTALPAFPAKPWLYGLLFIALVAGCNAAFQPKCDPAETPFMIANVYHTGFGYMGTDEYVPAGGDNYEIKSDFPPLRLLGENGGVAPAGARVTHLNTSTYHKQFTVESQQPVEVVLRLMNYPTWRVMVNGMKVEPGWEELTGRILITLPAGHSEVDVRFVRTLDRWIGDALSLAALIFLAGFWYVQKRNAELRVT